MNKHMKRLAAVVVLLMALVSLVAFVMPFARTASFWYGYVFLLIALAAQYPLAALAFTPDGGKRHSLYGFPIARLAVVYLVAQAAASLAEMTFSPVCPWQLALTINAVMLTAAAIGCIASVSVREEIERQDEKLKRDVRAMMELRSRAYALEQQMHGKPAAAPIAELAEALRFSDPVSSEETQESERSLASLMDEIENAATEGDDADAIQLCQRAMGLLRERNRLCKLNK